VVNLEKGCLLEGTLVSVKVENSDPAGVILDAWAKAIGDCMENVPAKDTLRGIGFAIPGPFDYKEGIGLYDSSNQKFEDLKDVNIRTEMSQRLGMDPLMFQFTNDATSFALGSYFFGSGKGTRRMVAITLGTGFGSSFINNGKAIEEGPTVPKEGCLWHIPYKEGIADDYFSTRWFVNQFNEYNEFQVTGVKEIAELAEQSDGFAQQLFHTFGKNLADCLAEPLKTFDAELVVMGGNIAEADALFMPSLQTGLASLGIQIPFKKSILKESAAMLGATAAFL
jgi:glucokinase